MQVVIVLGLMLLSFYSKAQEADVLHYRFVIRLSDASDTLNGYTEVDLVQKGKAAEVSFDLTGLRSDGKGMAVYNVQEIGPEKRWLSYKHEKDRLTISRANKTVRDTVTIGVWYKGIPADGLIISKNKHGDRTFFADNWPNRAHNWIPCVDRPDDKASFEFVVEAPQHYDVISNGIQPTPSSLQGSNRITHWCEDIPSPTKVMVIGVARFATKVYEDSRAGVPVSAWVYPQDSAKGFYDYAITPSIVRFFADYIAPFPYKKLANVQSKTIFGGMENASCIFYAEGSVTGDRSQEDLMAHEIAHQWFGDAASEKSFAHLWLSEGFATFLTNFYFEKTYGKEAARKRWTEQRNEVIAFARNSRRPVVDTTPNLMSLLNANSYQKGAWVLHMLRQQVGDSSFQQIIRTYYQRYKGGNADSRDFEAVAEEVSARDLTSFFTQWLHRPGVPKLTVQTKQTGNVLTVTVIQLEQAYHLRLPVQLQVNGRKEKAVMLELKERLHQFRIPVNGKATLQLDPEATLLFEQVK